MRRSRRQWWKLTVVVFGAGIVAGVTGCSPRTDRVDTTAHPVVSDTSHAQPPVATDTSRAAIVRAAQAFYDYGRERPPVAGRDKEFRGPHVADGSIPRMWIATASRKASAPPTRDVIVARIRSTADYPQMGLKAGYNYIWRSSSDSASAATWVSRIIPADTAAKSFTLTRDPRHIEFSHGNPKEPRLVRIKVGSEALGVCFDDPVCGGHCGYY
jgi:hypothetical protein